MRTRRLAWSLVAAPAALLAGCGSGADPAPRATSSSSTAASAASSAGAPDRRGNITDVSWPEVEGWIVRHEVCWAAPIANQRAFVTKCPSGAGDGSEHRTTLPSPDSLKKAVDAADPKHDTIGYTTNYASHREIEWAEATGLFATGTVYEVEVNQSLRAFITTTSLEGHVGAKYATVVASSNELARLAKSAPPPVFVKLFRVEEVPWKRALEVFASGQVTHAGSVHIGRVFLKDKSGREYLTIPPNEAALRQVEALAPGVPWTVE